MRVSIVPAIGYERCCVEVTVHLSASGASRKATPLERCLAEHEERFVPLP
jgi:hypothetical protein